MSAGLRADVAELAWLFVEYIEGYGRAVPERTLAARALAVRLATPEPPPAPVVPDADDAVAWGPSAEEVRIAQNTLSNAPSYASPARVIMREAVRLAVASGAVVPKAVYRADVAALAAKARAASNGADALDRAKRAEADARSWHDAYDRASDERDVALNALAAARTDQRIVALLREAADLDTRPSTVFNAAAAASARGLTATLTAAFDTATRIATDETTERAS